MCTADAKIDTRVLIGLTIALALVIAVAALLLLDTTGQKGSGLGEQFQYDLAELVKVDPNLILYAEVGDPIPTGFSNSRALAVDPNGNIYVAGDNAVRIFSRTGRKITQFQTTQSPTALTIGPNRNIYLAIANRIEQYTPQGRRLTTWSTDSDNAIITSIAVYHNHVFVADAANRLVLHFDTTGKLLNRIGRKDPDRNIPGFVIPSPYFDLAVATDGLLRVTNPGMHRIEAYTFDGDLEFFWGSFSSAIDGFCGCCNPVNFAILPDDSFVTVEKGLVRVKIYDPDGKFVGVVAGPQQLLPAKAARICETPAQCQAGGFDVAVDPDGRVLVLDTINNTIRIFARKTSQQ